MDNDSIVRALDDLEEDFRMLELTVSENCALIERLRKRIEALETVQTSLIVRITGMEELAEAMDDISEDDVKEAPFR